MHQPSWGDRQEQQQKEGSLGSKVSKQQIVKGRAVQLDSLCFICTSVRLLGEKRPEKCKAFSWLNSPAIPDILSYFYLGVRKTLRVH